MKVLTSLLFFVLLAFAVQVDAQESPRQISDMDNLSIQKGELENFKRQFYRFQTAIEDNDKESLAVLRNSMVELMKAECENQLTDDIERLELQQELLKKIQKEKSFIETSPLLNQFFQLMKEEVNAFEEGIGH